LNSPVRGLFDIDGLCGRTDVTLRLYTISKDAGSYFENAGGCGEISRHLIALPNCGPAGGTARRTWRQIAAQLPVIANSLKPYNDDRLSFATSIFPLK